MNAPLLVLVGFVVVPTLAIMTAASAKKDWICRGLLWGSFIAPLMLGTEVNPDASSSVSAHDALRAALPLVCVVVALTASRPVWVRSDLVEGMMTAFLLIVGFSATWSIDPKATVLKATLFTLQWIALFAVVRRYRSFNDVVRALAHLTHLLLISVAITAIIFPGKALTGNPARLQGAYPLISANIIGLLADIGLLALICGIHPAWLARRASLVPLLAVTYIAELMGARTRAALAVGVLLCLFALLSRARQRPGFAVGLTFAGVLGALVLATRVDSTLAFLSRGQDAAQLKSMTGRTTVWQAGLDLWHQHQLLGSGYYSGHRFGIVSLLYHGASQSNLDNMWLEVLVDLGVLGAIPLIAFVVLGLRRLIRALRQVDPALRAFAMSVSALCFVASFFNPSLQSNSLPAVILGTFLLAPAMRRQPLAPKEATLVITPPPRQEPVGL
jgi:O-antigen ligase